MHTNKHLHTQMRRAVFEKLGGQGDVKEADPSVWTSAFESALCHLHYGLPLPGGLTKQEVETNKHVYGYKNG
jgi:hypothetical protein